MSGQSDYTKESVRYDLSGEKLLMEQYFAGSAFADPVSAVELCSYITPDMITNQTLSTFWRRLIETGGDAAQAAIDSGDFEFVFGTLACVPTSLEIEKYAKRIMELNYLLRAVNGALEAVGLIHNRKTNEAMELFKSLSEGNIAADSSAMTPTQIHAEFSEFVYDLLTGKGVLKSFIPALDEAIGGYMPGELTIIAGRPGMGKTALSWQNARNIAINGKKVIYFSLEMSRLQLWARAACASCGLSWINVRSGHIDNPSLERLYNEGALLAGKLNDLLVIDDAYTLPQIQQACIQTNPDMVFIDNLGEIHWHDSSATDREWFGKAAKFLRDSIAKRKGHNIPVVLLHQLSRKVEDRINKKPVMSDLREDGNLEQIADNVVMIYREDYYEGYCGSAPVPMEVLLRKFRQGAANSSVILSYDLGAQWIE